MQWRMRLLFCTPYGTGFHRTTIRAVGGIVELLSEFVGKMNGDEMFRFSSFNK